MGKELKYKHTTYFRKADLENVAYSIWVPSVKHWRDVIEDYIEISKKRRDNKLAMFKLQTNLISDVVLLYDTIKGYIKFIEDPTEAAKEFPEQEITERTIDYWKQEIKTNKIILNALKDIGDGIAWRVLEYNRPLIYNMCINNDDAGPLTLNQGLISELHSLGDFTSDTTVVSSVFHGITNFLNIGDLTVKYDNGDINFIEVKSKKNPRGKSWKERLERQRTRAENIAKIANEGNGLSGEIDIRVRTIKFKPITILNKLETLLKRAKKSEMVSQIFSTYLGIIIYNFELIREKPNEEKSEKFFRQLQREKTDILINPSNIDGFIFTPNKTPLSIHPFSSETIANLLMGKYLLKYIFNVSQFQREIEKRGWEVSDILYNRKDTITGDSMFSIGKGKIKIKIPPSLVSRAIFEGLSVDSLLLECEDILKRENKNVDYGLYYRFEKEKFLWD